MSDIKKTLPDELKLYTIEEVANICRVSKRSIYTFIKDGRLKAVKIGKYWKVSETNLRAYINGEAQK